MINRVCTLTETAGGKPRKNNFNTGVDHISEQGNSGFYTVYRKARGQRHKCLYILWRHSAGLYLVWCKLSRATDLEAAPKNGMRFRAYVAQPVHGWRVYECKGKDNSLPVGFKQFEGQILRFATQPPAVVDADHIWIPADYPNLEIRNVKATTGVTCGDIDLVECILRTTDELDRPSESEDLDT